MAAFTAFCGVLLLVLDAAVLPYRRLPPLRRRRLLCDAATILMVLGASAVLHAAVAGPNDNDDTEASHALTAAGFFMWVAGVAMQLLALAPGRFPPVAAAAPARFAAQLVQAAAGAALF